MHIHIEFTSDKPIKLPIQYNHILQGFIYNTIEEKLSTFLHEQGYGEVRIFKLFTFSNLIGRYNMKTLPGYITFGNSVKLVISSPMDNFCESFANTIFRKSLNLNQNKIEVNDVTVEMQEVRQNSIRVETLSPVVVYSTLHKPEGKKYTCYFQPGEADFARIAAENLRRKFNAYERDSVPLGDISIKCEAQTKLHILNYKNTVIKGYSGRFSISGPKELLQTAVDAGLGSKNSQGFGCLRMI